MKKLCMYAVVDIKTGYELTGNYFLRAQNYFLPEQSNLCDYLIEDLGVG